MDRISLQLEAATRRTTSRKSKVPGTESPIMSMSSIPVERPWYQIFPGVPLFRGLLSASTTIPLSVRIVKRAIDLLVSVLGLLLVLPFFPALALLMHLDSPGPIFYRQRRAAALKESPGASRYAFAEFEMLKLRTMRVDAESRSGAVLATENDPRVTRLGRFLRKTRLDELPQLWNVLKGEMSLIGPRPERPELLENLALAIPFFEERMRDCKPGITGLAQVSLSYSGHAPEASFLASCEDSLTNPFGFELARGSLADDMRTKLLLDLAYVAGLERFNTFIRTELSVMIRTPWVMLRGLGR
jgi:lipopolysaccharide/colanic/teichoic acid biosynthesis glycosyltransferase